MGVRIVISGESQCVVFAHVCLIADYLEQNLPSFCYERIEKCVLDWQPWLVKINTKNKWHHSESPLIWKEVLMKGSKPYYIGGAAQFLDYCYSYYNFDSFVATEKFENLIKNFTQFKNKLIRENNDIFNASLKLKDVEPEIVDNDSDKSYIVCISGAGLNVALHIIARLFELTTCNRSLISKIYIFDEVCDDEFMDFVEKECSYLGTEYTGKIVKFVDRIGAALTHCDLFIILDHVPFSEDLAIGDWLHQNKVLMSDIAQMINASACQKIYILFPNLGPACYNATVLMNLVTDLHKDNIVVATSDLGLEIAPIVADIAEIPMRNMFCPPVWGFVGINHLVDIRTTVHKYNAFEPYKRYGKVNNSTLPIGSLTPEMRTLEYLMYFDETLWTRVEENKMISSERQILNKAAAAANVVKVWLCEPNASNIVNLGIPCDGTFGLNFEGIFSQPARLVDGKWKPAKEFMLPKDPQMKISYLEQIAVMIMKLHEKDLPRVIPHFPCPCKTTLIKKKHVW